MLSLWEQELVSSLDGILRDITRAIPDKQRMVIKGVAVTYPAKALITSQPVHFLFGLILPF